MCGLFGLVSSVALPKDQRNFVLQSTFVGTLRGDDSTGLALVDKDNNISVYKKALPGPDFLTSSMGVKAEAALDSSFVVIGHNRAATRGGKPCDLTAHPFEFGSIVGAHNGTLSYNNELPINKHKVDSMNLLDSLSSLDTPGKIVKLLEKVDGSYALTWYDASTEIMWLARNKDRPMSILDTGKFFYWTSEYNQLIWMLQRNGCLTSENVKKIVNLPVGTLFGYDTRAMEVAHSVNFTPVEKKTTHYGNYWQGSGKNTSSFSDDVITYSYNHEFKDKVAYLHLDKAIRKKMWSKEDRDVMLRFVSAEPLGASGTTVKYKGFAYTFDGEKFPCTVYGTNSSNYDFCTMYIGNINGIYKSETKAIIHMLSIIENSVSVMSSSKEEYEKTLESLESKKPVERKEEEATVTKMKPRIKPSFLKGPAKNEWISKEAFLKKVSSGCGSCGEAIDPKDHDKIGWLDGKQPICPDCVELVSESNMYGLSCTL